MDTVQLCPSIGIYNGMKFEKIANWNGWKWSGVFVMLNSNKKSKSKAWKLDK